MRVNSLILIALAGVTAGCTNSPLGQSPASATTQDLEVAQPTPPTGSLTASPLSESEPATTEIVDVADQLVFTWTSTGATQATSWYTVDSADTCTAAGGTGPFPWVADTLTGTTTVQYMSCQQGHTYTYYYVAQNSTGQTIQSTVVVTVNKNGTD